MEVPQRHVSDGKSKTARLVTEVNLLYVIVILYCVCILSVIFVFRTEKGVEVSQRIADGKTKTARVVTEAVVCCTVFAFRR